jgi:5-methylcytosine-specific restriction endonuclease McrA
MRVFKFSRGAWHKALRRHEIKTRPLGCPLDALLKNGKSRRNIKLRLLRAGLLKNHCYECGLTDWLGEPLTVQIDHINGVRDDHRFQNLRMLCPNCHSQTETYGRRDGKRARLQESPGAV